MSYVVPSITIITSTADGQPLALYRTRTIPTRNLIVADVLEASDLDAFLATPVSNQPGVSVSIHTMEGNAHRIPSIVWHTLWDALTEQLQTRAILRRAVCTRDQVNVDFIPDFTPDSPPLLATFAPKDLSHLITVHNLDPQHVVKTSIKPSMSCEPEIIHDFTNDMSDYLKPGQTPPF